MVPPHTDPLPTLSPMDPLLPTIVAGAKVLDGLGAEAEVMGIDVWQEPPNMAPLLTRVWPYPLTTPSMMSRWMTSTNGGWSRVDSSSTGTMSPRPIMMTPLPTLSPMDPLLPTNVAGAKVLDGLGAEAEVMGIDVWQEPPNMAPLLTRVCPYPLTTPSMMSRWMTSTNGGWSRVDSSSTGTMSPRPIMMV
ncbi:hypothetical protein R1sor_009944 [Riccia sorocarpa]|uniref:Uncharacterized protein n=1 Tax=Riccia sorocarpa TaxID=122646 RepID=A0ABD3HWI9_9MARC